MNGLSARQHLSLLIATFGMNGTLVVPKDDPTGSGDASASGSPAADSPARNLSSRVAERNRRSSRGGT
ncbi:hypothetical protein [Streptomyces sp. NBC_01429]|uniref:hypothetical protein n=1 Tax=Streptomyces sp. NBC_01429 TaxID=2903862 RepID=UPI002E2844B1|nr:hypothetical protein [Streptomyces sp. NBC_01429]